LEPKRVGDQGRRNGAEKSAPEAHAPRARQRPGREQDRYGRNRKSDLFGEDPDDQDPIAVTRHELDDGLHYPVVTPNRQYAMLRLSLDRAYRT
jgi:hypothetical protein